MNKKIKIAFASMLAVPLLACAQVRTEQTFEKGWKFTREDSKDFSNSTYDDAKWQSVTVPHDWAIYGPFSINNDKQNVAISQDGQKEAMEETFRMWPPAAMKGITRLVTAVSARTFKSTIRVSSAVSVSPKSPR